MDSKRSDSTCYNAIIESAQDYGMQFLTDMLRPPPPVRRFGDAYAVERDGIIWTLTTPSSKIVPAVDRKGHLVIPGTKLGVAYVVAMAWLPKPADNATIFFKDGNPKNVAARNLSWKSDSTIYTAKGSK